MKRKSGASTHADRLAGSIAEAAPSNEFPPGLRPDEASLAERFEVSRTPVREAIRLPRIAAVSMTPIERAAASQNRFGSRQRAANDSAATRRVASHLCAGLKMVPLEWAGPQRRDAKSSTSQKSGECAYKSRLGGPFQERGAESRLATRMRKPVLDCQSFFVFRLRAASRRRILSRTMRWSYGFDKVGPSSQRSPAFSAALATVPARMTTIFG